MNTVQIEKNGKTYTASYSVDGGMVTVYGETDDKTTQLGGMDALPLARMLLGHLVREGSISADEE